MPDGDNIQLSDNAAVVYEEFFIPAIFGQWAPQVADAARIGPGDRVLDVGCGTGILAREALGRVGTNGCVTGLDVNDSMLTVAKQQAPDIAWHQGDVANLPFDDDSFDVVVSQFMLMFVADKAGALSEMGRVLQPGGRLSIAVWSDSDAYEILADIARRRTSDDVAQTLTVPFSLGRPETLLGLFDQAGLKNARLESRDGWARFASIDEFVHTEIKGWVLADTLDDAGYEALLNDARNDLARFCDGSSDVKLPMNAHIVTVEKT